MKAPTGKELRDMGMAKALDRAGDEWREFILKKMRNYIRRRKQRGEQQFLMENFRAVVVSRKWPLPPSPNCWGGITGAAAKQGLIKRTRWLVPAQSAKTHGHLVRVWLAL